MNAKYQELIRLVREANVLASCGSLLGWDERTYLPTAGAAFRGEQAGLIARLTHEMLTSKRVGELIGESQFAEGTPEAANVREMKRAYDRATKLDPAFVEELAKVTTQAQGAWQAARAADDFTAFLPWLERVLELKKREAAMVGYSDHPYDALLDEYEPGASSKSIRAVFADLVKDTLPILRKIESSNRKPDASLLHRDFPVESQESFGRSAAGRIGFDFEAGRLDTTTHPFCSGIGPGDCRITTRYNPKFFNESFFGILHEAGHGIYEQGLPAEHFGTPLGAFCSLGIHESQSRLWENQVGRSKAFWRHFFPKAREVFPSLKGVDEAAFHFAVNEAKPSLIRVEADEATYNLHIVLRFEMEMDLLAGDLKPADVPAAWNDKFRRSFNITPPDDKQGCLQDIHWSMGGIGYFPTYTLGNLFAAQFMDKAKEDLPGLEEGFAEGEFLPLKTWLNDRIHAHGRRYTADELCRRVTGQPLSHKPFIAYLEAKFGELYGF